MKLVMSALVASLLIAPPYVYSDLEPKAVAVSIPRPKYGSDFPEGKGLFLLHLDQKTGRVLSVDVAKSTGFAVLDQSAIAAFRQWRFRPGPKSVRIPLEFTHKPESDFLRKAPPPH